MILKNIRVLGWAVFALGMSAWGAIAFAQRDPGIPPEVQQANSQQLIIEAPEQIPTNPIEFNPDPCLIGLRPQAVAIAPRHGRVDHSMLFDASQSLSGSTPIVEHLWQFGDGKSASGQVVLHAYSAVGVYQVTLQVIDGCGRVDTELFAADVGGNNSCANNLVPTAILTSNAPVEALIQVSFDGTDSRDTDGWITRYSWNFGDGSQTGWNAAEQIQHTYTAPGTYQATLRVMDNCGAISPTATLDVTILDVCEVNVNPTANPGEDRHGAVGVPVVFDASASVDSDGHLTQYWWNFDDGVFTGWQPDVVVEHTYLTAGEYDVTLWVMDDCEAFSAGVTTRAIITNDDPCANNVAPGAVAEGEVGGNVGQTLTFSGSGSTDADGAIAALDWQFGDGATASGVEVSHAYAAAGNYLVTLTVTDECGALDQDTLSVSVTVPDPCAGNLIPVAQAGADVTENAGQPIVFDGSASSDSDGEIVEYWWTFGNNQGTDWQSSPVVQYSYPTTGTFVVTLWVKDDCGAVSAADTLIATISPPDPCNTNLAPVANALGGGTAHTGQVLGFIGWTSYDPDGSITSYLWEFGDGATSTTSFSTHAYNVPGSYTATLTVYDACGVSNSDSVPVVITSPGNSCTGNSAPVAGAGPDRNALTNEVISFNGAGSTDIDGNIETFQWNFGDGSSGSGAMVGHSYSTAGQYTVTLTVTDECGAFSTDTAVATVTAPDPCLGNQSPTAFAGSDRNVLTNAVVNFSALGSGDSDGSIAEYHWDFGDGQSENGLQVSHAYTNPGSYFATLTVTDNCGATGVDSAMVTVTTPDPCVGNLLPFADAGPNQVVTAPAVVSFNGSGSIDLGGAIVAYSWNFGDGQTGSGVQTQHTYGVAGSYLVTLTVTDSCNAIDTDTMQVTVNAPDPCAGNVAPLAAAGPDQQVNVGVPVQFNGSGSSDANGTVVLYWWNFDDGQFTGWQASATATHTYTSVGVFGATLWVKDNCDAVSAGDNLNITTIPVDPCASNQPPTANISGGGQGEVGQPIGLSGLTSTDPDGGIVSYSWNFGDGQTGSGAVTSHAYSQAGTYTVTLTVADNCGATDAETTQVLVVPVDPCAGNLVPFAQAGSDVSAQTNQTILFSGGGSIDLDGSISSYSWNFGNGQTASGVSAVYAYTVVGVYTVTLTVTDNCGAARSDSLVATITAPDPCSGNSPPTAEAGANQNGDVDQVLLFSAAGSTDADGNLTISSYWWNFGDGQATGWQPNSSVTHSYSQGGPFTVTLWVRDNCGASSTADTALVTINQPDPCAGNVPPVANAIGSDLGQVGQAMNFSSTGSSDSDGTIVQYHWNFGDGATALGPDQSHVYQGDGNYIVTLTVTDNCGAARSDSIAVNVVAVNPGELNAEFVARVLKRIDPCTGAPVWEDVDFSSTTPIDLGAEVFFNASSSTGAVLFVWEFSPGSTGFGIEYPFVYETPGAYDITLTVYDAEFNVDTITKTLVVNRVFTYLDNLPLADMSASDLTVAGNTAWISHFAGALTTVDISNPSNLVQLSSIPATQSRGIDAANGYVYLCATSAGVLIYQGTIPTPTFRGTYNTNTIDGQRAQDAVIIGNLMYLAAGPAGLKLLDLRQAPNLTVVATTLLPDNAPAQVVAVGDGMAYVADDTGRVFQFDVSGIDPNAPLPGTTPLRGTMDNEWIVSFLALSTENDVLVAYSSPGGMFLYDVCDLSDTTPDQLGYMDVPSEADGLNPSSLIIKGSNLYAGFGQTLTYGTAVARISIADPANPYITEWQSMDGQVAGITRGGVLVGNHLFFANSKYNAVSIYVSHP